MLWDGHDSIYVRDESARANGTFTRGDTVEIFGANRLVDDAATAAGTISYEMLTSITPRVPRLYVG